jgi:hypothetical protein
MLNEIFLLQRYSNKIKLLILDYYLLIFTLPLYNHPGRMTYLGGQRSLNVAKLFDGPITIRPLSTTEQSDNLAQKKLRF